MKRINKKEEGRIIILSIAVGMTVCFFSPFELMWVNQVEFLLNPQNIVIALLITTIIAIALLFLLLNAALIISRTLYRFLRSLVFGFLISGYVQILFFNGRMTVFNNDTETAIQVKDFSMYSIVNFFIYSIIFLTPMIVTAITIEKEKKGEAVRYFRPGIIVYISVAMLIMQTIGALSLVFSGKTVENDLEYPRGLSFFSYKGVTQLSTDENIIVFVVDRLDGDWLDATIDCYPELSEALSGFTYYRDNVSRHSLTFPSVAQTLTGREYNGKNWHDYISEAWSEGNLMDVLHQNGYSVNLCIDSNTTYNSVRDVVKYADNMIVPKRDEKTEAVYQLNYTGDGGVVQLMLYCSLAKLLPYYYKNSVITAIGSNPTERFISFDGNRIDLQPNPTSNVSDRAFYHYVKERGLTAESNSRKFVFVHLNGVHNPDEIMAGLAPDNGQNAHKVIGQEITIATARGSLSIISEYIEQMKKLNVFDNSTILIMGDHGRQPNELLAKNGRLNSPIITALLIKPQKAKENTLRINNELPTSNLYIPATILELAGIDHTTFGLSIQDVMKGNYPDRRTLSFYYFSGFFTSCSDICTYQIEGNARDFAHWEYEAP